MNPTLFQQLAGDSPLKAQMSRTCVCGKRILFTWAWERRQAAISESGVWLGVRHEGDQTERCAGVMQLIQLQITNWLHRTRVDIVRTLQGLIDEETLWLPESTSDVESDDSPAT